MSSTEEEVPIAVEERVDLRHRLVFLSDVAVAFMRYPYISTRLTVRYEPESAYLESVVLWVIGLLNSDHPLNENCMFKYKGSGENRHKPAFHPMDRFTTTDGVPSHTLWEKHSTCMVTYEGFGIKVTFMEPSSPVPPETGFIFNFNEGNVRKVISHTTDVTVDNLIASIVKHIKVPLYKATDGKTIINEGPFPVWNEPKEGDAKEAFDNWALVQNAASEYEALFQWATPFPVIEDCGGMEGHVNVTVTGGVLAIYTRGLVPKGNQAYAKPEVMFKIPFELPMPREERSTFGKMPNWKTHPDEYVAFMKGGCIKKRGKEARFPVCGRPLAPINECRQEHELLLLGCSGKLVQKSSDLSAGKEIDIRWPTVYEMSNEEIEAYDNIEEPLCDWKYCQASPSVIYESAVYHKRTTFTTAAFKAGPIVTEKHLRRIETHLKDKGDVSEGTTTYVRVDYMGYGDTFTVLAFVHKRGIIYQPSMSSNMNVLKPKLGWTLVPPVFLTVCNDEKKGASFYFRDSDKRDVHVTKDRRKIAEPQITLDKGLPGVYGYNLERGLCVVSESFTFMPEGIVSKNMDDPVTVGKMLAIANPEFINQMGCIGSKQVREYDENIVKYLTYVPPAEEPLIKVQIEAENIRRQQEAKAEQYVRLTQEFWAENPASPFMDDENYGKWEEGKYERAGYPIRIFDGAKLVRIGHTGNPAARPLAQMARIARKYHPYRILGL